MPSDAPVLARSDSIPSALRPGMWRARCGCAWLAMAAAVTAGAAQLDIAGPDGGATFGDQITVLPNGNVVVCDSNAGNGIGAVYLYGTSGNLISTLKGSTEGDNIGSRPVVVLANGNYLIHSPQWHNDSAENAGAVTWGSATTGVSGVVSAENSLVGTTAFDEVGSLQSTALTNGNYVVASPGFDNDAVVDAGAATWGNGTTGTVGPVDATNSLVGTSNFDGTAGVLVSALKNGNYVVANSNWNNGGIGDAGAVTWRSGASGTADVVSVANSLFGTGGGNRVGSSGVTVLTNGNYVVRSSLWDDDSTADVGAATWCNGAAATVGPVTTANSLHGTTPVDRVGIQGIALTNGNYVVSSTLWNNVLVVDAGAATLGNGLGGTVGPVTPANSLVGSSTQDRVSQATQFGIGGVVALTNGNYVVVSSQWNDLDVGAVTWGNGVSGVTGTVSPSNSLVGGSVGDRVGNVDGNQSPFAVFGGVVALANGNYVIASLQWDGADPDVGAATFVDGSTGAIGFVSASNSLVGSSTADFAQVRIIPLTNGNYVVGNINFKNADAQGAGSATWGDGTTGTVGPITAANSLLGSTEFEELGYVRPLTNGNYLVGARLWDNGGVVNAGAVAWCEGTAATTGGVSTENSLVGSSENDIVYTGSGFPGESPGEGKAYPGGAYIVSSANWDDGENVDVGAVTLGLGDGSVTGPITPLNSVLGTAPSAGSTMTFGFDAPRTTMWVGRPASNILTRFDLLLFGDGFESP